MQHLRKLLRDLPHRKLLRTHHRGDSHRLLQAGLAGKRSGNQYRRKRVHCQNIRDMNIRICFSAYFTHALPDAAEHISYVGVRLAGHITDSARITDRFHDLICTFVQRNSDRMFRIQINLSGRKHILPDVSVRRPDHNCAPVSNQALGNRCHGPRLIRIEMKQCGNAVGI